MSAPICGADPRNTRVYRGTLQVLLLTGFLATILVRVLKNEILNYARVDEEGGVHPTTHTLHPAP